MNKSKRSLLTLHHLKKESVDPNLPTFTWNVTNMVTRPFLLNVDFHDGKDSDVAILMPMRDEDGKEDLSILRGSLRFEQPIVEISVNGRPNDDTFDVICF